jgi:alpha-L-fucosidase
VPLRWKQHYFDRVTDLLARYEPDMLYTDGQLFFDAWGLGLAAHLYNRSAARHGGRAETVYANKDRHNCAQGVCLLDLERGVVDKVWDDPWQTDTCIGNWHYDRYASYKSPKLVIDMLVDIVSRNGNLLLNFPLPSSGALDYEELVILDAITKWMAVNSEAIYGTRPWKTFGSGPATDKAAAAMEAGSFHGAESFNENKRKLLTGADVRYTKKGSTLYAFSMGCNGGSARFAELAQGATKVERVTLLGHKGDVTWRQTSDALVIDLPNEAPCEHAVAFRVDGV